MSDCFYCAAYLDPASAALITLTDSFVAIPDRFPLAPGHVLVFPTRHVPDAFALPQRAWLDLMLVSRDLALALQDHSGIGKIGMFVAGKEREDHAHHHLLPLRTGLKSTLSNLTDNPRTELSLIEQRRLAREVAACLNRRGAEEQ